MFLSQRCLSSDVEERSFDPDFSQTLHNLGILYVKQRIWDRALESNEKAIEIRRRVVAESSNTTARHALAMSLANSGAILVNLGSFLAADAFLCEAVGICEQTCVEQSGQRKEELSTILLSRGWMYLKRNHLTEALQDTERALTLREQSYTLGKGQPVPYAKALRHRSTIRRIMGDLVGALNDVEKAFIIVETQRLLPISEEHVNDDDAESLNGIAWLLYTKAAIHDDGGQLAMALVDLGTAIEIFERLQAQRPATDAHHALLAYLSSRALIFWKLMRPTDALEDCRRGLELLRWEETHDPSLRFLYTEFLDLYGAALWDLSRPEDAVEYWNRAHFVLDGAAEQPITEIRAIVSTDRGRALEWQGRPDEAHGSYSQAISTWDDLLQESMVPDHANRYAFIRILRFRLNQAARRKEQASEDLQIAEEVMDQLLQNGALWFELAHFFHDSVILHSDDPNPTTHFV